ncbi:E3 ubiquitin-protein ligase RMA3-like [Pyrus communis]|uniref:E3 ubiquitin-protein ligase RMA3-like n=1 Tax=Pyrus communis TaxID=23211 RepID=UPI0035C0455B
MEQNFYEPETHFVSVGDVSVKKWNSVSSPTTVSDNDTGCFECNICLDSAHEPVVTLCGHLYCWPCIYKWLQVPTASDEQSHLQQTCPVCKANITPSSVVPLYGRGLSSSDSDGKKSQLDLVVPRRPPPSTATTATSVPRQQLHPNFLQRHSESVHDQYYPAYGGYATNSDSAYLGGTTMTNLSNPTIGMVGEFVFARMFGNSNTNLFTYPYPNSYTPSSLRMRRQEVELDKSLNRVTIFLFCCFMLCLLLF